MWQYIIAFRYLLIPGYRFRLNYMYGTEINAIIFPNFKKKNWKLWLLDGQRNEAMGPLDCIRIRISGIYNTFVETIKFKGKLIVFSIVNKKQFCRNGENEVDFQQVTRSRSFFSLTLGWYTGVKMWISQFWSRISMRSMPYICRETFSSPGLCWTYQDSPIMLTIMNNISGGDYGIDNNTYVCIWQCEYDEEFASKWLLGGRLVVSLP